MQAMQDHPACVHAGLPLEFEQLFGPPLEKGKGVGITSNQVVEDLARRQIVRVDLGGALDGMVIAGRVLRLVQL